MVWFKRDLRIEDHAPLLRASQEGPCVCLYVYEPELLAAPDVSATHVAFINGCLAELGEQIEALGGQLVIRRGDIIDVLSELNRTVGFRRIRSHQETGTEVTYRRDLRVKRWAEEHHIEWIETRQHGVFRGQKDRNGWAAKWNADMSCPQAPAVAGLQSFPGLASTGILSTTELGLGAPPQTEVQSPGSRAALRTLHEFLHQRGEPYQKAMSSPLEGATACSRLSPYLAYGALSMRQVYQSYQRRAHELRTRKKEGEQGLGTWSRSLSSFNKRLHWNGHFTQRLESDPSIEKRPLVRAFEGIRSEAPNLEHFEAWKEGRTGYPMVDACMRFLNATGWLNFRMRSMLVSFASYHLWLPWQMTGTYLARRFLDYEPGIHYNQLQMQSGVTGINAIRIYAPTKQALDQDPEGTFIRRWVPELENLPLRWLAEPHHIDMIDRHQSGFVPGESYPLPIVEHREAVRAARDRIFAVRRTDEAKAQAQDVLKRHGSRRKRRGRH